MIIKSPLPYQVIQRGPRNTAPIPILVEAAAPIEARLLLGKNVIADWRKIPASGGSIKNVPVGGPYTLEVRTGDKVKRVPGLLIGDLWILAGQSNMDGCGKLIDLEPPSKHVNCFYYGDTWGVAADPLCLLNYAVEPVHWASPDPAVREGGRQWDRLYRDFGAGLGVRFGKEMHKATGIPVGLIMCSHGGTPMWQWDPKLKSKGGESLYGTLIRRVNLCGGKVAGCLWYQGESDTDASVVAGYKKNTRRLIESLRSDLGDPNLPFLYVQLGPFLIWDPNLNIAGWNSVRDQQLQLESEMKNIALAAAIDCTVSDPIHLDAVSEKRIGMRLAKLARRIAFGEKIEVGPRPDKIAFVDGDRTRIRVTYRGVNRKLYPARGIWGFSVEMDGAPIPILKRAVEPDGKSVLLTLANPAPKGANLWYGRGLFPTVDLKDGENFAAPCFGPYPLK